MTLPREFPALNQGEYAVLCAEAATGIVLSVTGTRAIGTAERYRIFSTAEEASECAKGLVAANPLWECAVFNHEGVVTESYRDEKAVLSAATRKPRTSWWRRRFSK